MIYDDNIHKALEKVAAHQGKRNLGDFVGAGTGAAVGLTAAEKLLRKRLKLPGAAIAGLGGSLLGIEGSRALRSGARRREMRRRGAEAQEYLRQVRKSKRLARGIQRRDAVKTANVSKLLSKIFKSPKPSPGYQRSLAAAKARGSKRVPGYTPKKQKLPKILGMNTTPGRSAATGAGFKKVANIQMVKMFLRQGLGIEAAVKRAYPTWSRARRAALVRRLRG